jgi:hypothetical protein
MLWMSLEEDLFRFGTEGIRGRLNYGDRGWTAFPRLSDREKGHLSSGMGESISPGGLA